MDQKSLSRLDAAMVLARSQGAAQFFADPWRQMRSRLLAWNCRRRGTIARRQAQTFWGERMLVIYPEPVSVAIDRYGYYERDVTCCLLERLRPGMTFFDVGAHFGFFSTLAAQIVGPTGHVHAFEPMRSAFEVLSTNLGGRPNVTLIKRAAFDRSTTLELRDSGVARTIFQVPAVALDEYVAATATIPDFVKIQADGAEPQVLSGMRTILSGVTGPRPAVLLEVGDGVVPDGKRASRQVVQFLLDAGYQALEFDNRRWVPHRLKDSYARSTLLFEQKPAELPRTGRERIRSHSGAAEIDRFD